VQQALLRAAISVVRFEADQAGADGIIT